MSQTIPSLERFRSVLAPALANRLRGTLRDRVEAAWLALGGPACVADRTDLDDADAYLDALEQLEEGGEVDFARLAELLGELYAQPDAAAGEDDLQIMTIHKAKGLEFGTVIVPGLDIVPFAGAAPLLRWQELPGGDAEEKRRSRLLLAPIRPAGEKKELTYEYLRLLEADAEDTEAARLLYVAATRAERRLHLIACPRKTMPPRRSLLARAWPVARTVYEGLAPPQDEDAPAALEPFVLRRLAADWTPPAPPAPAAWTPPSGGREEAQVEFSWAGETARHVGSVVHRWLQRIAEDELRGWDAKRVESLRLRFEIELQRRGVEAPAAAAKQVAAALNNMLMDERGRWILGPHPVAKSEHRISTPARRSLRIDRYIEDANGVRWVIDFKTGEHRGGLEAYLDEQVTRYAPQLDAYSEAMQGAQRGLYFPLLKGWREW